MCETAPPSWALSQVSERSTSLALMCLRRSGSLPIICLDFEHNTHEILTPTSGSATLRTLDLLVALFVLPCRAACLRASLPAAHVATMGLVHRLLTNTLFVLFLCFRTLDPLTDHISHVAYRAHRRYASFGEVTVRPSQDIQAKLRHVQDYPYEPARCYRCLRSHHLDVTSLEPERGDL